METTSASACDFKLRKNQIIQNISQNICYRVLYLPDTREGDGYWIPVNSNSNIPQPFRPDEVHEQIAIGTMEEVADTVPVPLDNELNDKGIQRRDKIWNLIRHIVSIEPDIYMYSRRTALLKKVEDASGVKLNNLYSYLGKYWRGGCRPNALAPNYRNCGGARVTENRKSSAGRKKRDGENGKILTEEDFRIFRYAIEHYYQNEKKMTLHQTYNHMLAHHYVKPRYEGDPEPPTMSADEKPSFGQFYYWYMKNRDPVEDTVRREGENKFNLRHRAITGKTETNLLGPGDCFQVDATIGDFYLVMEADRSRLLGRPVIVFFKDAWSRMVTGMTVTLENSSSFVWKAALLNTVTPKVEYCRQFGIEIKEEEWPCHMLPNSITTDNGEFAVKSIDDIVSKLGITVENCPPYRGDLKGIIERTFGVLQLTLRPYVPGYVEKDAGERGATDYRRSSSIDLKTFTAILIKAVLFYNNYHYLTEYSRTGDMRKNGIPAIPLHLWNYGIAHKTGTLRSLPNDIYMDVLLQQGKATVTPKGIRFDDLYYTCENAVSERWMERARIEGTYTIDIRFNPFSCKNIYIKDSEGKYISCPLVDSLHEFEGYSQEELDALHQMDLDMKATCKQKEDQESSNMIHFVEVLTKRCENEKKNGETIIETLKKHSTDENREEEKKNLSGKAEAEQVQSALGLNEEPRNTTTAPESERTNGYQALSRDIDEFMETVWEKTSPDS